FEFLAVQNNSSSIDVDVSPQLPFGGFLGPSHEISSSDVKKGGGNTKNDSERRNKNSAGSGYEFFAAFYKSDKTFPIVLGFMCLGPVLGFWLMITCGIWVGGGVL